jgi:RNA polymerase sigma-70 factor (ECF subfamily)
LSFDELTAPHVRKISRVVHRITRNREDAEDAMQDALLQALVHFQDFDGRSAFATWLTRIAINSSLMILRKRRNARTVSLNGANDSEESQVFQKIRDTAADAEEQFLQKERETALREAIQTLRPSLRDVVEVVLLGERSIRETAEMLDLSVAAAKARLFHARRSLKKAQTLQRFRRPVTK